MVFWSPHLQGYIQKHLSVYSRYVFYLLASFSCKYFVTVNIIIDIYSVTYAIPNFTA